MKHLLTLFALTAALLSGQSHAAERPNVILIISDDQGFTDYGFMGHKVVRRRTSTAWRRRACSIRAAT